MIKAVLFDLYDTLVYADRQKLKEKINRCANICRVEADEFQDAWHSLTVESNLGKFPNTKDRVNEVLKILRIAQNQEIIEAVAEAEHEFLKSGMYLFEDTFNTLDRLQAAGLKLGLVTNASPSVQVVLSTHQLDKYLRCIVVSSEVGFRKPDPMIYQIALERLAEKASESIFVGDGNDMELEGAHDIGMTTILIKRNMAKYVKMQDSSLKSANFITGTLTEVVNLVLNKIDKDGS